MVLMMRGALGRMLRGDHGRGHVRARDVVVVGDRRHQQENRGECPGERQALAALVAALDEWLAGPREEILAAWRPRDALIGRPVRWENGSKEGVAAGIDSAGALVVDTADGQVTLDAGEVHLER